MTSWMDRRTIGGMCVLGVGLGLGGCASSTEPGPDVQLPATVDLQYRTVASGLSSPVHLTTPDGDDRLFIVERVGRVRIVENDVLLSTPFLDINTSVSKGGEQGLLSMAFHPDYAANGFFYVSYTDTQGDTQIVRYTVSADPNVADAASALTILSEPQPFPNHNGGLITFGPDDMLYIGLGDGGSGNDPINAGQSLDTLLGSILRIDVDAASPYGIPADNPFVGDPNALDEIWTYGLRNPWRFSFDLVDNMLYIGDVGQNAREEVTAIDASTGGLNLGWKIMEGRQCRVSPCDMTGLVLPQLDYPNPNDGCAVVGGFVYRGADMPDLQGLYFYSDNCGGWMRSFRLSGADAIERRQYNLPTLSITSFGVDTVGELYVTVADGTVRRILEAPGT